MPPTRVVGAAAGTSAADPAEVDELRNRVSDLEGQLNESKRLLELRNTELADLQAKLAASQQAAGRAADARRPWSRHRPRRRRGDPETAQPEATPRRKPPCAAGTDAGPPRDSRPDARADTGREPKSRVGRPSLRRQDPGLLVGARGAGRARPCRRVAKSRGKRKTAEFDDNLGRLAEQGEDRLARARRSMSDTGRMRAPAESTVPDDILVEESGTHRALQETQDIPLAPTVRTDETISSETAINLDQGDPLAEADFHMAYGLYDQAADLVRIAIQREPERRDLKLKLLEVFFVWGNKEQFLHDRRASSASRAATRRAGRVGKDRHHGQADRARRSDVRRRLPAAAARWAST